MTVVASKTCTSCKKVLEATPANFHKQKNGRYGFTSKCKPCKNLEIAEWTRKNPEMSRAQKMRWKALNYEKYLQIKRDDQRRRKYRLRSGKVGVEEWKKMLAEYNFSCAHCGSQDDITQDHIIPLSRGGANLIENIQPLCRSCNSRKRDKV
jgi:5-methylcytosine-specific restriction endonuclease McrA